MAGGDHTLWSDMVGAAAIGALDPTDQERFDRHVATCPVCAEELEGLRGAVELLALGVPERTPPPALRRRVLADARRSPRGRPVRLLRRRVPLALALGTLALGVVAGGVVVWTGNDHGPSARVITASVGRIHGEVTIAAGGAVVRVRGLAALPAGSGYELWRIPVSGAPVSAGFLSQVDDPRGGVATVADLRGTRALALTRERLTNTAAPSRAPMMVMTLPA